MDQEHKAASKPLTHSNQALKGNDQAIKHTLPIKSVDPSCKHLNRLDISDYPLVLHCNKLLVIVGNRLVHKLGASLSAVFKIKILTEPVGGFYTSPVLASYIILRCTVALNTLQTT